jgi:ribose transport system permease protein
MSIKGLKLNPTMIALLLAIVLFIVGGIIRPGFANYGLAMNILLLASFLGIVAAGLTLIIIAGGEGIDLSVGSIVTLGAILIYNISNGQNDKLFLALVVALVVGALIGAVNGLGITFLRVPPLVMTLGMAGVVEGLILVVTQGQVNGGAAPIMSVLTGPIVFGIPAVVLVWILLGIIMWVILERTRYGKHLFAIGVNRTAAKLSGVRVPTTLILTYALSGLLASFGGFVLLSYTQKVFLTLGETYTLPSVAAVVVGGTLLSGGQGSYQGTMAGALVLTILTSLLTTMQLPDSARQITYGVVLLLLLSIYGRQSKLRG